jgi:DNA-binding NarL/FixJ family response regulator
MQTTPIKVLLLCINPLLRGGIKAALDDHADLAVHVDVCDADEGPADVVVADYECAMEMLDVHRRRVHGHTPKVLILTGRDSESDVLTAVQAGALGYLPVACQLDELVESVRALYRGARRLSDVATQRVVEGLLHETLTAREAEVMRLLASGAPNKTIATRLDIAVGTVKTHIKNILTKLDAASRTEAVAVATRRGLLTRATGPSPRPAIDRPQSHHGLVNRSIHGSFL